VEKAVVYYRVSTDKQGERGLGMQAQQHAVEQYINANDCELIAEFKEVESGKKSDRPEFLKAKNAAKYHGATLLIAKLDRLSRDVVFIGQLIKEEGLKFIALDMPQASTFELHIRASLAEEEARLISERTKAGLARSNKPLGSANPVIKEKALAKRRQNAADFIETYRPLVEFIISTVDKVSYTAVAKQFNEQGRKTAQGKDWTYTTVKRLFKQIQEKYG